MENSVKESPILFSSGMVRALLDGRKTQTRRIVNKPIPVGHKFHGWIIESTDKKRDGCAAWSIGDDALAYDLMVAKCKYGKPGDRLWVRETSIITPKHWNDGFMCDHTDKEGDPRMVQYIATHPNTEGADDYKLKKTPSIFMPRWASRILLEVTNVSVERLQDISEEDAKSEGAHAINFGYGDCYALGFKQLWESINGQGSWDLNPWVWVIEFKVLECEK